MNAKEAFFTKGVLAAAGNPYQKNYIPTCAKLNDGTLLAVWGAGVYDGKQLDTRMMASVSKDNARTWSKPFRLGGKPNAWNGDPSILVDGNKVMVFFAVVNDPSVIEQIETWQTVSVDSGNTWSEPILFTAMPHKYSDARTGLKLRNGRLVLPYSWDVWLEQGMIPKTEGEMVLGSSVLLSDDHGKTWKPGQELTIHVPKTSPFSAGGVCEPSVVELSNGELYMLMRTGTPNPWEARSQDGGETWSDPKPSSMTSHNTPVGLLRLANSKELVAVWNNSPRDRWPLVVALSTDEARSWPKPKELSNTPGFQASYPSITQANDETIFVVWQQQLARNEGREIHFAYFNRAWLEQ